MSFKNLLTPILFATSVTVAEAASEAPISEIQVTTIVKEHSGAVGGLMVDALGYIYSSDFEEQVWRLHPDDGVVTPYAQGFYGASGNTFDKNGNLYQASYYGGYISRIDRSGTVTTTHTEGLVGPVGMIFDADNNLYVCACNEQKVKKITPEGVMSDFVWSGHFNCPNGITQDDAGNFYVVSFSGPKIIKVTPEGEASVLADTGGKGLGHILHLRGILYATSFLDNKLYRITLEGEVSHFAGSGEHADADGNADSSSFANPNGIAADPTGTFIYVNDKLGNFATSSPVTSKFSIRQIELPRLSKIVEYHINEQSIAAAKDAYNRYKNQATNRSENTLVEMNLLGWKYMREDKYAEAVAIHEMNARSYPVAWNVFSSLGAAYMKVGAKEQAIDALERSIELKPDNKIAAERLKSLLPE